MSTRQRRWRATVAVLALAGITISACGTGSGEDEVGATGTAPASSTPATPSSTEADGSTGDTAVAPDDASLAVIDQLLATEPTLVKLGVNYSVTASGPVTASAGGDVSLDLGGKAKATLHFPAGALPADEIVTLALVRSVGDTSAIGVEIEPSGVLFPPGRFPTLRITGLAGGFASSPAFLADRDGVVERIDAMPGPSGSLEVVLPHFSDLFFTDDIRTVPMTPFDDAMIRLREVLNAERDRQLGEPDVLPNSDFTATTTKIMRDVYRSYILPLLQQAAKQCSGYDAIGQFLRWLTQVQLLGLDDTLSDSSYVAPTQAILIKEMDCAISDCEKTVGRHQTALTRYLRALAQAELLGVFSEEEEGRYTTRAEQLLSCWVSEVRIVGVARGTGNLAGPIAIEDQFVAQGTIWQDDTKTCKLGELVVPCGGPRRRTIPMTVTENGEPEAATQFARLLATAVSWGNKELSGSCKLSPFPTGVVDVTLTPVAAPSPTDPPQMTLAFRPFLATATMSCPAPLNISIPFKWVFSLAGLQIPETKLVDRGPDGFFHTFDNNTEYRAVRSWHYDKKSVFDVEGAHSEFEIHIRLWAPRTIGVPLGNTSTDGLIDLTTTSLLGR